MTNTSSASSSSATTAQAAEIEAVTNPSKRAPDHEVDEQEDGSPLRRVRVSKQNTVARGPAEEELIDVLNLVLPFLTQAGTGALCQTSKKIRYFLRDEDENDSPNNHTDTRSLVSWYLHNVTRKSFGHWGMGDSILESWRIVLALERKAWRPENLREVRLRAENGFHAVNIQCFMKIFCQHFRKPEGGGGIFRLLDDGCVEFGESVLTYDGEGRYMWLDTTAGGNKFEKKQEEPQREEDMSEAALHLEKEVMRAGWPRNLEQFEIEVPKRYWHKALTRPPFILSDEEARWLRVQACTAQMRKLLRAQLLNRRNECSDNRRADVATLFESRVHDIANAEAWEARGSEDELGEDEQFHKFSRRVVCCLDIPGCPCPPFEGKNPVRVPLRRRM
ncbi:unnamed protein product [Amoebophrya sp. A25]|nr:unnamed protein product [Amoebophrya sp. A25]|eukprot:GSA25T00019411001.1